MLPTYLNDDTTFPDNDMLHYMPGAAAGKTAEELFSEINTEMEHLFIEDNDAPSIVSQRAEMGAERFRRY